MAAERGFPHADHLLASLTPAQFDELLVFDALEPGGWLQLATMLADLYLGLLIQSGADDLPTRREVLESWGYRVPDDADAWDDLTEEQQIRSTMAIAHQMAR
ncbi:MAG: hypothetical protein ACYTGL_13830 [Planctomycetota bacterium]